MLDPHLLEIVRAMARATARADNARDGLISNEKISCTEETKGEGERSSTPDIQQTSKRTDQLTIKWRYAESMPLATP